MKKVFYIILLLICCLGYGQNAPWSNPNFHKKKILAKDSVLLDSLVVLPEKFILKNKNGEIINPNSYSLIPARSVVVFKSSFSDSLQVEYYTHPYLNVKNYANNPALILDRNLVEIQKNKPQKKKEIDLLEGLDTQGEISRGIIMGNNQGTSFKSSLDLTIKGKLNDEIGIEANIMDTNVPIETDGFTQNLDQFDRVYISLFTEKSKATAGHIFLEENEQYFSSFQRKITGLQLEHSFLIDSMPTNLSLTGSLSRGEYRQYSFNGLEGNQGPYILTGNENETYITILSGTEKVYINGRLLTRGEDQDYIINYNTGELTFTNKNMISASQRILTEYQYTVQNYTRLLLYGKAKHTNKRWSIQANYFSEKDNKNSAISQTLTDDDITTLKNYTGNNAIYSSSAVLTTYDADKTLYKKTEVNGVSVYEFTNENLPELYEIYFSYLGEGEGDYIRSNSAENKVIYTYQPPINGVSQGQYAPVKQLIPPTQKQQIELSSSVQWREHGKFNLDYALNQYNANSFNDENQTTASGINLQIEDAFQWGDWTMRPMLNYQMIGKNFSPIQRIREVEFARDYNLPDDLFSYNQQFIRGGFSTQYLDLFDFNYELNMLRLSNEYSGTRHNTALFFNKNNYAVQLNFDYLNAVAQNLPSSRIDYSFVAEKKVKKWTWGVGANGESNRENSSANYLTAESFKQNEVSAFASYNQQSIKVYKTQQDSAALGQMSRYSNAWGVNGQFTLLNTTKNRLNLNAHYRKVSYTDEQLEDTQLLNAGVNWNKNMLSGGITTLVNYQLSGGTVLERAFTYERVSDGLGIYMWTDYNQDGIEQIDEFEVATFQDQANYVRVFTNTTKRLNVNKNNLKASLIISPKNWVKSSFWKRWEQRIFYNTNSDYLKNGEIAAWNPFSSNENVRMNNTYLQWASFYNLGNNYRWHINYEYLQQKSEQLIYTGLDRVITRQHKLNFSYDLNAYTLISLKGNTNQSRSLSEQFSSRRYFIKSKSISPEVSFRLNKKVLSFYYKLTQSKNTEGIENLTQQDLSLDFRWFRNERFNLYGSLSWINNNFNTTLQTTLAANKMMDGLRSGQNWVAELNIEQRFLNNLSLNIIYNARKNESSKLIQTGNIEVNLHF